MRVFRKGSIFSIFIFYHLQKVDASLYLNSAKSKSTFELISKALGDIEDI